MPLVRFLATLFAAIMATSVVAAAPEPGRFYAFVDEEARGGFNGMSGFAAPWPAQERAKVEEALAVIHARAPNLLANAAGRGPVKLYNSIKAGEELKCQAMYVENAIACGPQLLGRPLLLHAIAHELVHLVDSRHRPVELSRSKEWRDLLEPRIARLDAKLREAGFKGIDDAIRSRDPRKLELAFAEGLPSVYGAKNITEALAEYASYLIVPQKVGPDQVLPPVPPEIRALIRARILAPLPPPDETRRLYDEALGHLDRNDYPRALQALDRTIASDAAFAAAYNTRGRVLMQLKQLDPAVRDLTTAIALYGPDEWRAKSPHGLRGKAWSGLGQWSQAAADFTWLIERDPADATSYALRGRARAAIRDYGGARSDFAECLRLAPQRKQEVDAWLQALEREQRGKAR